MKKVLRFVTFAMTLILAIPSLSFGQAPNIRWEKSYSGGGMISESYSTCGTNDGGSIFIGSVDSIQNAFTPLAGQGWLVKLDSLGNVQWQRLIPHDTAGNIYFQKIRQTRDNGFILIGNYDESKYDSTSPGTYYKEFDGVVVKIDSIGNIQWQKNFLPVDTVGYYFYNLGESIDGNYIIVGNLYDIKPSSGNFVNRGSIIKLDSLGNTIWEYTSLDSRVFYSVNQISHKEYLIAGSFNNEGLVSKIDSGKNVIWEKHYFSGTSGYGSFSNIIVLNDGNYIIAGHTDGWSLPSNHGYEEIVLMKIDSNGNSAWQKCFGGSNDDFLCGAIKSNSGEIVISSVTRSSDGDILNNTDTTYENPWIFSIDTSGNVIWQFSFGSKGVEVINDFIQTSNLDYVIAGWIRIDDSIKNPNSHIQAYIVRFSPQTILASHDLHLNAVLEKGIARLKWNPETNQEYEIQRSTDLKVWETLSKTISSNFDDVHPLAGTSYYRLKVFEKDGIFTYSNIEKIIYRPNTIKVFPMIVQSTCTISGIKTREQVRVYNALGVLLFSKVSSGNSMELNLSNYPKGMYVITAGEYSTKIIKQ